MNGLEGLDPDAVAYVTQVCREDGVAVPMKGFLDGVNVINPVRTGLHRHSYQPWAVSEPTVAPGAAPFLPPLGHDAVDRALETFVLGGPAGITNLQPYSGPLLAGSSPQNRELEGDLDALVAEVAVL